MQSKGLLGSRKCIREDLKTAEHLANSRIQQALVARTQERRGIVLPKSGRQSKSHRRLLGFSYERAEKCETSGRNVSRSCKTERMFLLEKCSNVVHLI